MLKYLSETGQAARNQDFDAEARFYIDPRGKEYAPISGTPSYVELASTDPVGVPGRFALAEAATLSYLLPGFNPTTFTVQIMAKPKLAFNIASDSFLLRMASEITVASKDRFGIYYESTGDYFASEMGIAASTTVIERTDIVYTSDIQLQQWIRFTHVQDGNDGTLYQGNSKLADTLTTTAIKDTPLMIVGTGAYDIKYIRLFPNYAATDDEVRTGFQHVGNEEIYWDFEKNAVGRTRCNVDRENTHCVKSFSINRPAGYKASSASVGLLNLSGEFNTDQFATFTPSAGGYNGTEDEHFLARKVGLEIEEWRKKPNNDADLYDAIGMWDAEGVPEIPDNVAGTTYINAVGWTDGVDGWTSGGAGGTLTIADGALNFDFSGTNPRLLQTISIDTAVNKTVRARVRRVAGTTTALSLRNNALTIVYADEEYAGNGAWQTIDFNVGASANWTGTLTELAMLIVAETSCTWQVEFIYIGTGLYDHPLPDYSGNSVHGVINGCTPVKVGTRIAQRGDGVDDYISMPSIPVAGNFTIGGWIQRVKSGAVQYLIGIGGNGALVRFAFRFDASNNFTINRMVGATAVVTNIQSDSGINTHRMATYDGSNTRIYTNGILVATVAGAIDATSDGIFRLFAGTFTAVGQWFGGTILEPFISDLVLTQSQITKLAAGYPLTYYTNRDPDFERIFKGAIPQGSFPRQTRHGGLSTVSLSAEDAMTDLGRKIARKSYKWEDYELAQADGSNSLFHELARIVTRREFRNYLGNSSFENATIGNSWLTDGTFDRDTTVLLAGSYIGKLTATAGQYILQYVTFGGEDSLSIGDVFTASFWVYSASAIVGTIRCGESLAAVSTGYTDAAYTHSGLGWEKWIVSHTVADSTSDRMRIVLLAGAGGFTNVPVDCAMLKRGGDVDWWILNAEDGTSGVISYEDAQDGAYDWVGVDTNDVDYVHPWAWVQKGDTVIDHLQELSLACGARNFRVDSAGVLVMESGLVDDAPDSLGDLASGNAISGGLVPVMNAIELKGCYLEKKPLESNVWMAGASAGLKKATTDTDGNFSRTVANGDQIPDDDPAVDNVPTYIAKYAQYEETERKQ